MALQYIEQLILKQESVTLEFKKSTAQLFLRFAQGFEILKKIDFILNMNKFVFIILVFISF